LKGKSLKGGKRLWFNTCQKVLSFGEDLGEANEYKKKEYQYRQI
jgi:hypothetical protein